MPRISLAFREFLVAHGGNIAISAALLFPLLMTMAALVVDEASLYHQKRQLQAAVDMAAIHAAADPANALTRAHRTLLDYRVVDPAIPLAALVDPASGPLRVVTGRYVPDPDLSVSSRFTPGASPPNAVDVRYELPGTLHFARVFMAEPPRISVGALASATPHAGFSIGSRLAHLEDGVANAVLGQLLGAELSLSLLDYRAIAALDIKLPDFLDALAGRIGLSAGTYGEVLDARVRLADIAFSLVAAAGANNPAGAVLLELAGAIDDSIHVEMARIIAADGLAQLAVGTPEAGAALGVDALQLLSVSALLADGQRQAQLALGVGLPGIAGIAVQLVVGEPPQGAWYTYGETGSFVRTAQVRLKIDVTVLGNGGVGVGPLTIALPIYAELAFAEAGLAALTCVPGRPDMARAQLAVRPGLLRLAVGSIPAGTFLDTARPLTVSRGTIVNVAGIARVTARANIESAQINPQIVHFSQAEIAGGAVKTVSTSTPLSSLTRSLIGNLDLRLEILGTNLLGGLLNGLTGTVQALVNPVAPALDSVLMALFDVLGLSVGEADVRMHGIDCRAAALVR